MTSERDYEALMRDAVPAAREACGSGEWGSSGAKGGARALLGRALLATLERTEKTRPDVPTLLDEAREAMEADGYRLAASMLRNDPAEIEDVIHDVSERPLDEQNRRTLRALCALYLKITEP